MAVCRPRQRRQGRRAQKDQRGPKGQRVPKDRRDQRGPKGQRVRPVQRDPRDQPGWDWMCFLGNLALRDYTFRGLVNKVTSFVKVSELQSQVGRN